METIKEPIKLFCKVLLHLSKFYHILLSILGRHIKERKVKYLLQYGVLSLYNLVPIFTILHPNYWEFDTVPQSASPLHYAGWCSFATNWCWVDPVDQIIEIKLYLCHFSISNQQKRHFRAIMVELSNLKVFK